jgi:PTH1 family peptidyl-tRNA hydrolase
MKLIVGLGNPGISNSNSRHNIGFVCLRHFACHQGIKLDRKQGYARTGYGHIGDIPLLLARPQTYMNESGRAVMALMRKFSIDPADLVVIHDDIDLPPGKIRIRLGGSSAGHKGINSIFSYLSSAEFLRIRVGVGRPDRRETGSPLVEENGIISFVLGDFSPEEKEVMAKIVPQVSDAICCLINCGLTAAMNSYN